MTPELMTAALESIKDPFVLVDLDHTILYLNKPGAENYSKWGGASLVGKCLLDCHNEESCRAIEEIVAAMHAGEDERLISSNDRRRIYMRAVRDTDGKLIAYYERYEWVQSQNV